MPIGNGEGYTLKVETNIGGKVFHDEEVREVYYSTPKPERKPTSYDMNVFGHGNDQPPAPAPEQKVVKPFAKAKPQQKRKPKAVAAPEFIPDAEMEKAMNKDLETRGIKKPRKTKTTKTTD